MVEQLNKLFMWRKGREGKGGKLIRSSHDTRTGPHWGISGEEKAADAERAQRPELYD